MKKTINRSVLVVIPRQPFSDWAGQVFGDPDTGPFEECASYLLDDEWNVDDVERFLKKNYDEIFTEMLHGVCTFPEAWPEKRSWKMFNEWFEWHYSSLVWDMLPGKGIRRENL